MGASGPKSSFTKWTFYEFIKQAVQKHLGVEERCNPVLSGLLILMKKGKKKMTEVTSCARSGFETASSTFYFQAFCPIGVHREQS